MGDSHPARPSGSRGHAVGVFTTDTALTIQTWDDWLFHATAISAEAANGRALMDVIPDLAQRGLLAPFEQVLSRGVVEILAPALHRYLIACPPIGGSPTFERMQQRVTIGPLREDGRVIGTIVAIEDVTARVERERDLAAQLASLRPDVRVRAANLLADSEAIDGADPLMGVIGDEDWRVRRAAVQGLSRRTTSEMIAAVLLALRDEHRNFSVLSSAIELLAATAVDVVPPLIELLRHPDPDLRLQAALVLGERADGRAVPPLVEALADPDENLRFHAIEALGKLKAGAAVEALASVAESADFFLAFPALDAIAQIGDPTVAPRLAPLITHELLRSAVAETLGRIGDEDVVPPLTGLLNEASAPTEVVAGALAAVYHRYENRYGDGDRIARAVRQTIGPAGTRNLLDAVQRATAGELRSIATVLGWLEGQAVDRALTRLLGQPSVRGKVVEYLVRHGERVVDLLIEGLEAEDVDTRHAAVVGLGRIGDRRATPALLELLRGDPALMLVTAGALARIGDSRAFEPLLGLIGDADPAVRQAVIAAINSIGHPETASRIVPLLGHAEGRVRESAVRIAGYFGYLECADALLACLSDPDQGVRRAAIEHVAFLDDPRVVPALLDSLSGVDPIMRAAAAQALARVEDTRVGPALAASLCDADSWVRYFAARALGEQRHPGAADGLTRLALDDPGGHVRVAATDALGHIGSPAAIPTLSTLGESDDGEQAAAAIRALGGIAHPDALPPLKAALRAQDPGRRGAAVQALVGAAWSDAVEELEWTAAADADESVVVAAVRGLASLASRESVRPEAVRALIGLAAEPSRRELVIALLGGLDAGAIQYLAHGLRDPRAGVRVAVLQALGRMRSAEASRWLEAALDDEGAEVRLAALTELRHLGTRGVERRLVSVARSDTDTAVRRAALAALKGSS